MGLPYRCGQTIEKSKFQNQKPFVTPIRLFSMSTNVNPSFPALHLMLACCVLLEMPVGCITTKPKTTLPSSHGMKPRLLSPIHPSPCTIRCSIDPSECPDGLSLWEMPPLPVVLVRAITAKDRVGVDVIFSEATHTWLDSRDSTADLSHPHPAQRWPQGGGCVVQSAIGLNKSR